MTECATEHKSDDNIERTKYGMCIPEKYGHDIESFEKDLEEIRSRSVKKKATGFKIKTKKKQNKNKNKNKKLFFGLFS